MKKKKAGRVLLSFLLTLAMVIGFMPGMCMTAHADNTEELLTTLTFGGSSTYSETKSGVVSVTATNVTSYDDTYGWLFFDVGSLSVTAEEGYTINKCVFRQNNKQPITDTEAPFEIHFSYGCCTANGDMDGVTSIEVYRYVTPTTVDVTGVSLNKTTTTLTVGDTETLTATVSPDDASEKSVTWSSDKTSVATVDANGKVTAVAEGTANITVTATNGTDDINDDKKATCAVTVEPISYNVTYKVVNGTWDGTSTADKTETVASGGNPASVPTGMKANSGYTGGSWDTDPSTATISADTTFTYTFTEQQSISQTVTFKVVNGTWDDGNTSDKIITLSGMEGDTLRLSSGQIPAVGTKPNDGYKAGSWDVTPSTDTAISSNVTYTYTYVADSSGGSSDSGSGDSSGGSSDSGSGSSSSGSTDSGSGSSSGGSSDSGNTSGGTSSGSSDNTNTNTDTSAKVPYDDVATSTGSVNDITGTASATAESNPFGTKIENNSNLTTLLSLTDAEVAQGVNVWLDIQDMSSSVSKMDKSLIQDKSGDYTVGLYLDINLFKKVGSNDATKVTETNGKVKASILIPESLWKSGRTFEIIRVHDGVATAIAGTYDENTHVFTFETDKFSTYALAYKDPASSSDSGTASDSGSSNSSNSTQSTAPKTGDPNDIRVWYLLLIASFGGLGFLGLSKKKEN